MVRMENDIKVNMMSLNVRGLQNAIKRRSIFSWIRSLKMDIVMLQESHSSSKDELIWANEWGNKALFSHGSTNSKGVLFLFNSRVNLNMHKVYRDESGRIICVHVDIENNPFLILNLYAPNVENLQVQFYEDLLKILETEWGGQENIVIGGDFNCILDPQLDKMGGTHVLKKKVVQKIRDIMVPFELIDIWRSMNGNKRQFTWRQNSPFVQCRLDYFLVNGDLKHKVKRVNIVRALRTDHSAVCMEILMNKNKRGKGYWKLNASLLQDEEYVKVMRENIGAWKKEYSFLEPRTKWDWIKYKIRCFSVEYSRTVQKQTTNIEQQLRSKLNVLENKLTIRGEEDVIAEIEKIKEELIEIDNKRVAGLMVRSRSRWYEKGEKSNDYFLGLEKRNNTRKLCYELKVDGQLVTEFRDILYAQMQYYEILYASKLEAGFEDQCDAFLEKIDVPTLTVEEREELEKPISKKECREVLNDLAKNKSPGNDGIPVEFYQTFWNDIEDIFMESVLDGFDKGEMSISQRQAILILIKKEGKDERELKNWRPISLLNVDVKIVTKVFAKRMCRFIDKLISVCQTGFVKGRYIGESIRVIIDIMFYTKMHNIPGLLFFLDYEKAFDSLEWDFMMKVLSKFGFGPKFQSYIQTFYNNISSCICSNGHTSGYFCLSRGVRQGDPISPYLFILCVEILSSAIRQNKQIRGIEIDGYAVSIVQYADDTTLVLADLESAKEAFDIIEDFASFSGLRINKSKTNAMWLGSRRNCKLKPLDINLPSEPFRVLGILLSTDMEQMISLNFEKCLVDVKVMLNVWRKRNLSLIGKIQIVKTFALSKFVYCGSVLPIPSHILKQLENVIKDFVWNGKNRYVKKLSLIGSYEQGGLNMIHIPSFFNALKVKWIARFLNEGSSLWSVIFKYFMKKFGGHFILYCNMSKKSCITMGQCPSFYRDILSAYFDFRLLDLKYKEKSETIVWNNEYVRVNGRTVFFAEFFRAGLWYISDLFDREGRLLDFNTWMRRGVEKQMYMKWCSIVSAIPKELKLRCLSNRELIPTLKLSCVFKGKTIDFMKLTTQIINCILKNRNFVAPTSEIYWSNKYAIDDSTWPLIYKMPFVCLSDTKSRTFQYKINTRTLLLNKRLYKMKIVDSELCTFCKQVDETPEHIFAECQHACNFWEEFLKWWHTRFDINLQLKEEEILFGVLGGSLNRLLLNHCMVIAKQMIYACRHLGILPSFELFWSKLKIIYVTEKQIGFQNRQVSKFERKWKNLHASLI